MMPSSSSSERGNEGTNTAKKPPPKPPSRARGRSRWPYLLRVKKLRSWPGLGRARSSSVSLCPSKIGNALSIATLEFLSGLARRLIGPAGLIFAAQIAQDVPRPWMAHPRDRGHGRLAVIGHAAEPCLVAGLIGVQQHVAGPQIGGGRVADAA